MTCIKSTFYRNDRLPREPATYSLHSDLHQHEIKTANQLTCILFKKIILSLFIDLIFNTCIKAVHIAKLTFASTLYLKTNISTAENI